MGLYIDKGYVLFDIVNNLEMFILKCSIILIYVAILRYLAVLTKDS